VFAGDDDTDDNAVGCVVKRSSWSSWNRMEEAKEAGERPAGGRWGA